MIVSTLSVFLSGSKRTRLLRQGIAGQTVEIVAVSWMANPCGRSSRSIRLRVPPAFGVGDGGGAWLVAGPTRASVSSTRDAKSAAMRRREQHEGRKKRRDAQACHRLTS